MSLRHAPVHLPSVVESMEEVSVSESRLSDYRPVIGEAAYSELLALASKLKGRRVAHVNATAYGGGVAEMLHSIVPLQRDLGLDAHWFVLRAPDGFYDVSKALHNALQGAEVALTPNMLASYRHVNEDDAPNFSDDFDFVVIHDPQPAPLVSLCERNGAWFWRCHIDLTNTSAAGLAAIDPYLGAYDVCIFSAKAYVPRNASIRQAFVMTPAIDPLSPKNRDVTMEERAEVISRFPFDPDRPVVSQVGRFDPWKDPIGVIDAYRQVKEEISDIQLLLIGSMARDDPESSAWLDRTVQHAGDDPDVRVLTDLDAIEVNVLQRATHVALAKSLREGFGLTVSESLWKQVPVVGGNVGGIPLQIENGRHGFLVSSVPEAATRTLQLLRDEKRRESMGKAGRERVRRHFLITRNLRDALRLFVRTTEG